MRLIDADALISYLTDNWIPANIDEIDAQPTIEQERKKGEWTKDNSCPFCGFLHWYERDIHTLSFCPNCGADMRGEKHDAD